MFSESFYWTTSIVIILMNMCFYAIIQPMIARVGFYTKTSEHRLTGLTVFVCLFLDMCVLPMFLAMSLVEHSDDPASGAGTSSKGKFTDFNDQWYPDVGSGIMITIIFFSF